jgi:hypothetical protein
MADPPPLRCRTLVHLKTPGDIERGRIPLFEYEITLWQFHTDYADIMQYGAAGPKEFLPPDKTGRSTEALRDLWY